MCNYVLHFNHQVLIITIKFMYYRCIIGTELNKYNYTIRCVLLSEILFTVYQNNINVFYIDIVYNTALSQLRICRAPTPTGVVETLWKRRNVLNRMGKKILKKCKKFIFWFIAKSQQKLRWRHHKNDTKITWPCHN